MHHDFVNLFGDEVTDGLACGGALALAVSTGLFRIMSDRHWVTDVMTGALVGTLAGTLLPYLLHFRGGAIAPLRGQTAPPLAFAPMIGEDTIGLHALGLW
jgi:membrane-associated phospholipid phosphatase